MLNLKVTAVFRKIIFFLISPVYFYLAVLTYLGLRTGTNFIRSWKNKAWTSDCCSSPQWFVSTAGQRGTDLPALLWGHSGLAVPQRGTTAYSVTPAALCGCGTRGKQLWPHHCLCQAFRAVPWGTAVPGERRGPGAARGGPTGLIRSASGAMLQPDARGEGGFVFAGHTAPGHQQEDRILQIRAERRLECTGFNGPQPCQQWRWASYQAAMLDRACFRSDIQVMV